MVLSGFFLIQLIQHYREYKQLKLFTLTLDLSLQNLEKKHEALNMRFNYLENPSSRPSKQIKGSSKMSALESKMSNLEKSLKPKAKKSSILKEKVGHQTRILSQVLPREPQKNPRTKVRGSWRKK